MKNNVKIIAFMGLFSVASISLSAQNQTDDKGRKQGEWIKKTPEGRILSKGMYKDDIPEGTFVYYNKRGVVEMRNTYSDKGEKVHTELLYPNGKIKAEGNYVNKKKEGLWVYKTAKGVKIAEENYKGNLKDGVEKNWDTEGKNIIRSTTYKQGRKNGEYFQSLYAEGYYTMTYKDDKAEGDYRRYTSTKTLKLKGQYSSDKKVGVWEEYDSMGEVVRKLVYDNDVLTDDILRLNVQNGVKEISQKDIAMIRSAGKQTQIVLFNGDRINVFNSTEAVILLTDENVFMRVNEKQELYLNVAAMQGINSDGSVKTKVDTGMKIIPDKDGKQLLNSLFRKD